MRAHWLPYWYIFYLGMHCTNLGTKYLGKHEGWRTADGRRQIVDAGTRTLEGAHICKPSSEALFQAVRSVLHDRQVAPMCHVSYLNPRKFCNSAGLVKLLDVISP